MSQEACIFVRVSDASLPHLTELQARVAAAAQRGETLPPGDRTEIQRMQAIQAAMDQIALAMVWSGAPHELATGRTEHRGPSLFLAEPAPLFAPSEASAWLREGAAVYALWLPHAEGSTLVGGVEGRGPPPPAEKWRSVAEGRTDAIRERFEHRVGLALRDPNATGAALYPSGISNMVLADGLRDIAGVGKAEAGTLRVVYKDGSEGPPFPVAAVRFADTAPNSMRVLRFALMSIRHVEMDAIVDGAWLRNSRISQSREAGYTDALVYETSLAQLEHLIKSGPLHLHMYQTGMEAPVVGFYRAVVKTLMREPERLAVTPFYLDGGTYRAARPWRAA